MSFGEVTPKWRRFNASFEKTKHGSISKQLSARWWTCEDLGCLQPQNLDTVQSLSHNIKYEAKARSKPGHASGQ